MRWDFSQNFTISIITDAKLSDVNGNYFSR